MAENSAAAPSSSKRMKKSLPHETNEQLKLQLDSEKALCEVQSFAEEIFATRKSSQTGPSLNSFVDPVVNLNIDVLLKRFQSSTPSGELTSKINPNIPGGLETLLQKLTSENEILKRKETTHRVAEKLTRRQDTIIKDLKKEVAKSRTWISDLQQQNDRLSSQLFMYQMQQNSIIQLQHNKAAQDESDYSIRIQQHVKSENIDSPLLDTSDD